MFAPRRRKAYSPTMRLRRAVVAGLLGVGMMMVACGPETHRPSFHKYEDDLPEFSATRIGDPDDSVVNFLGPDEQKAVQRAGLPMHEEAPPSEGVGNNDLNPDETTMDKVGHASVAALGVGVTLFMMAAPYLLF